MIPFRRKQHQEVPVSYSDVEYVRGLLNDDLRVQESLYHYWKDYFMTRARGIFFGLDDNQMCDIVHDSYMILWRKVRNGLIYVEDDQLKGRQGMPFTCALTTYMMEVAKLKRKENLRSAGDLLYLEELSVLRRMGDDAEEVELPRDIQLELDDPYIFLGTDYDSVKHEIVAGLIAEMSERCNQILNMFYYKSMGLDTMMSTLNTFNSKDALKTAKNKCLSRLKESARKQYKDFLRATV